MTDMRKLTHSEERLEIGFIMALAFVLPLVEAPKNLLAFGYLLVWLWHRVRHAGLAARWQGWMSWDGLFATTLVAAFIGTALAGIKANEWTGMRDVFRYVLLAWLLLRSEYSQSSWRMVLAALVAGTLIACGIGAWSLMRNGGVELELHSVGHSNHSATFLCIVFGAAVAWLLSDWPGLRRGWRVAGVAVVILLALAVIATGSRIAAAMLIVIAVGLAVVTGMSANRTWKPLGVVVASLIAAIAFGALFQPWVLKKHLRNVQDNNVLAFRGELWTRALTAWQANPLFGVGMDNYSAITPARLNAWEAAQAKPLTPAGAFTSSHAHSLYLDALAERGALGAGLMMAMFLGWAVMLWRRRPAWGAGAGAGSVDGALWGASLAAMLTTLIIGLVNTTLHTELAMVAVLWLGAARGIPPCETVTNR